MSTVFWCVRLGNNSDSAWPTGAWSAGRGNLRPVDRKGREIFSRRSALEEASRWPDEWRARLVRVTKRPKPAPALQVGDSVVLHGRIDYEQATGGYIVRLSQGGQLYAVSRADIIRAPKEK